MIVFIPQTDPQCNSGQEPDWEWLPRICPACGGKSMIGHGRRSKHAHAPHCDRIRVRRAICKLCEITCTILPAWSPPYTHYALETRQQSADNFLAGKPLKEAAPVLKHPDRSPDESTLRRWLRPAIEAIRSWLLAVRCWLARKSPGIAHHPCLGFWGSPAYSDPGGKPDEIPRSGP